LVHYKVYTATDGDEMARLLAEAFPPRDPLAFGAGLTPPEFEAFVRLKHSYRMLLADRVKEDLIDAVEDTRPEGAVKDALELIDDWDNTAAPDSRGAILFEAWWRQYSARRPEEDQFAEVWSEDDPLKTPRGLADPARAVEAFSRAVDETTGRYGRVDVPWGSG
jgi:acyl-homoserine-lactone acylase